MDAMDVTQSIFRWIHVVAGVLWIGLLYFFNWVNGPFAATMDGETKKKVVPELLPRALFWFRWGAVWTWVTGILLLLLVFYHGGATFASGVGSAVGYVGLALVLAAPFLYEILTKLMKKNEVLAVVGVGLIAALVYVMLTFLGYGFRGYAIHIGAMFGTIMAFNVWFRIWPAQKKIITAVKGGTPPDAALVAMAGSRSKHNTYLSVPLVLMMLNTHSTWMASQWWILPAAVAVALFGVKHLYSKAGKVKGF
ncbi:MAG TPA: urate hydroxylase PuuD [bacterium]|nr:urate hydroxylase PuuD [bacterium]